MPQKLTRVAALALALVAAPPIGAMAAADASAPIVLQSAPAAAEPVDDGALRFFAQQGQMERVAAELKRLQAIYPGYRQPDDLFKAGNGNASPEDQPLWDLFGANKLEELHEAINARMADDPGWQPPADLMKKVQHKETRAKVMTLWGEKSWRKLLTLAKEDPSLADTDDVELMWTLAEGYAKSKQTAQAVAIYTSLLGANEKAQERLATLQKAMANLRMAEVEALYELGHKDAKGANEFDVIKIDLTRARISAFLHDERKDNVAPADVAAFAEFARKSDDPNQPGLVAWYRYKRREFSEALDWFKFALEHGGDAKIAHGLAHSLRQLRKFRDAEEVAYAWRQYDIANSLLFIDLLEMDLTKEIPPYIEDERLARYGKVAAEQASGEGAQALAWYAYNSCQYYTALEWFQRANAWQPKEATVYGLALSYRRLGDRAHFVETVNRYDGLFPKVVALIFPDDRYLPPTPCEETVLAPLAAPDPSRPQAPYALVSAVGRRDNEPSAGGIGPQQKPMQTATGDDGDTPPPDPTTDPTIAYPPGTAPDYPGSIHDPLRRYSWGRVQSPTGAPFRVVEPNYCGDPWQPATFNPNEFPLMVNPQNPLRFAPTGLPTANPIPASALAPAPPVFPAREPFAPQWPLLARRVPGVLPMPYEHNGFTLQYANIPDPARRGQLAQTIRFVAPQQIAGFWTKPWAPEAAKVRVAKKGLNDASITNLAGCASRPQARLQPPPGYPLAPAPNAAFPAYPGYPAYPANVQTPATAPSYPVANPPPVSQLRGALEPEALPLLATVAWRGGIDFTPTGSLAGLEQTTAPQRSNGVQLAQASPYNPNGSQPLGAYPAPPSNPLNLPQGYNAILSPQLPAYGAPAPAYAQPPVYVPPQTYAPQPAPYYPAAYPVQPAPYYPQANPALAQPAAPARRQRVIAKRKAPAPHARASTASAHGCSGGASPTAALTLGWCLMQLDRPQEAAVAFDRALANGVGKTREDAAYGKSLASLRGNLINPAVEAANTVDLAPKRRNEIGIAVLSQRAVAAYNNGGYSQALAALDQRRPFAPESRDLTMIRAWSHYHLGELDEAKRLFSVLDQQTSTKESRQGMGAVDARVLGRRN